MDLTRVYLKSTSLPRLGGIDFFHPRTDLQEVYLIYNMDLENCWVKWTGGRSLS